MNTLSRSKRQRAIDAKCKDCNYDPYSKGSWRYQIETCESNDCPLHPFRPLTIKSYSSDES